MRNIRYHQEAKHNQALVEHHREKARREKKLKEKRNQALIERFCEKAGANRS